MKYLLSLILVLMISINGNSQTKTNGKSGPATTINFSDTTIPDYNPSLHSLDKHPIPASEYGDKKEVLYQLRLKKRQEEINKKKSSQSNEVIPNILKQYEGNQGNGAPSDNDIAVSNGEKVFSAVNTNFAIFNNAGAQLASKTLSQLAAQLGTFTQLSDPRIIYDNQMDRWIFVCFDGFLSTTSKIILGFSKTNDPAALWNFYKLNGASFGDKTWSDYPIIAVNGSDFYMTFNQVMDSVHWSVGFNQSVIWQIDKSRGYNGDTLQYTLWSDIKYKGSNLRNICPAKPQTYEVNDKMYFLSVRNVDNTNDSIFLLEIDNKYSSGNAQMTTKVLKSPVKYGFPPNAIQAKSAGGIHQQLMTNDARVLAAIYENDYIHFGSNSVNLDHLNAGICLGTIKNVSKLKPTVTAKIFSSSGLEYGYPSMTQVDTALKHRILYTFSHCVTDSFPGMSMMYQNTNGEFSPPYRIKEGFSIVDAFTDSVERWGDYSNAQRIYSASNSAYIVGSFGRFNRMRTWIAKIDINDTVTPIPIPSNSVNSQSIETKVSFYPNPIQTNFETKFNLNQNEVLRFSIFDLSGKLIVNLLETKGFAGENEFKFNNESLPVGRYYLSIKGDINTDLKIKFIKE